MKKPTLEEVKEHFKNAKVVMDYYGDSIKVKDLNKIYQNRHLNYLYRNQDYNSTYLWNEDYGYAKIIEYKKEKNIDVVYEEIKPKHYELNVVSRKTGKTLICDYLDIANAMNLSIEQFLALRYMRVKGDVNKQINDTEKGIESLKAHRDKLTINKT